ncbi:hypothetical protein F5B19DRAFT_175653 [Rostrohypoxylon terebratum]|nr:hypothetical protein F5B19DRAFT_175653 [Rostrohypoxylon terebratum]
MVESGAPVKKDPFLQHLPRSLTKRGPPLLRASNDTCLRLNISRTIIYQGYCYQPAMEHRVNPSPELVQLLKNISQFNIDDAAVTKVELKSIDGTPRKVQVSRVNWPPEEDEIVQKAIQRAIDESKSKIRQVAPQCRSWFANTLLLEEGSLRPEEGKACIVIPIIGASWPLAKMNFHHLQARPGEPEAWRTQLYILETDMCIRVMDGKLLYISVLCIEQEQQQQSDRESGGNPVQSR